MATSSLFENVKITDPKIADSLVEALESSAAASKPTPGKRITAHMATPEERKRLFELRQKNRRTKT